MRQRSDSGFWQLFRREVVLIPKDHSLLLTLLIAPLLYAFFYGSIYINKEEEQVKLALVDDDQSNLSRVLRQQLNNMNLVDVKLYPNLSEARESMYQGYSQGYLYIPDGTESQILRMQSAQVVMAVNAARFLPSSDILMTVQQICTVAGAGVRLQYFEKAQGMGSEAAAQQVMPINLDYRPLYNERASYGTFLLPGLLALILQQTLLIGLSESVAAERQKKSIAAWTADGINSAIWGKGLFYLILFMAYGLFFLGVNFKILDLPMRGHFGELLLLIFLFIMTLIPLAQLIGTSFSTQLVCLQVMAFSTYPIFLISGYVWPLQSLPMALQWLSNLLPTTPFLKAYIHLVQAGTALRELMPTVLHLCSLFLLYSIICFLRIRSLKKKASEN